MLHAPSTSDAQSSDQSWRRLEDLVQEIAGLSRDALPVRQFYTELLGRAVGALGAVGGAAWLVGPDGLQRECGIGSHENGSGLPDRPELIEDVLRTGRATAAEPREVPAKRGQAPSSGDGPLLLCPIPMAGDEQMLGVLEVRQRPDSPLSARRGALEFLEVLADLASEFHRNRELRELRVRAGSWNRLEEFTSQVHASLDLKETAYSIANEGRRVVGCDRLSVAIVRGKTCRLTAVSGLESVNRRSNAVRRLEQLAAAVAASGEPLGHPDDTGERPAELAGPLEAYLEESRVRSLAVIPLNDSVGRTSKSVPMMPDGLGSPSYRATAPSQSGDRPPVLGLLIVERFDEAPADESQETLTAFVRQRGQTALRQALEYESLPFLPLLKRVQGTGGLLRGRRLPRTVLCLLLAAAGVLALTLIPADFAVEGRGELQPKLRREVFAAGEGVIDEVRVGHADRVAAGDALVVLRDPQLELEFVRVLGEMQTARKRLAAVQTARLSTAATTAAAVAQAKLLTAEEEELRELLRGLEQQHELLLAQQAHLTVRSPVGGQVLTWDVGQMLEMRPVQRGQFLMTVGDLAGPWIVEMRVADRRIGDVLAAQRDARSDLDVSFVLATDPGTTYRGRVETVALTSEFDERSGAAVQVTVAFDRDAVPRLRPGATVIARISCGRRSLGYVWLHDLLHAIQTRLLF